MTIVIWTLYSAALVGGRFWRWWTWLWRGGLWGYYMEAFSVVTKSDLCIQELTFNAFKA
jgi:hypothetical protein